MKSYPMGICRRPVKVKVEMLPMGHLLRGQEMGVRTEMLL